MQDADDVKDSTSQIHSSRCARLLPALLSVIAGSADVISFLGLGLFSAHVTGNLVVLIAQILGRGTGAACLVLSLPLFILVLGLTRLLVAGLEALGIGSLRPLLLLQFLMLGGAFVLCLVSGDHRDSGARNTLIAGQLAVAAMAVQNALVQLSLQGTPPTTVMTTDLTRFIMDAGEVLLGHNPAEVAEARHRAKHTWPVIIGFIAGAGLGAVCFAAGGLKSLGLPAGLALLALVMSLAIRPVGRKQ
ncbi:YoaK family protein [Pedosphaera parvula]|uniref:DUF1275 domain-containing protein n=1 Tax=Pedosphaera parvula (strain Ellin514) TaxID=320771 RepID=B9XNT5_PEDPL|nr:YoaK family protein [Pedosphaera parvula]EEF58508.1 protein of unknown function DUF1275 [Pedosphaera parvula Ellin514]